MRLCIKPLDVLLITMYFILFAISGFYDSWGKWLLAYSIVICIRLMWLHRYNQSLLIMLTFVSTYFIYMTLYYFLGISYSTYRNLQTLEYTNGTLRIVSLFVILLFYQIKKKSVTDPPMRECLEYTHNKWILFMSVCVMIGILLYALHGNNIFHYTYSKTTTNSTLFEYYFMFSIIAQCNINKAVEKYVVMIINLLYVAAMLLLGLRLVTLMVLMSLFVFYFEDRIKTRWVIIGAITGFFLMSAMASIRVGVTNLDLYGLLGVRDNVMMNNQGDVFLTSTVHYGMTKNGFMTISDRLQSLAAFICNFFLPSSRQLTKGILNKYIQGTYAVGGGGFGVMYAYVWLGYAGVFFLAWFISHHINRAFSKKKASYYGIFLVITSFRWFAYSLPIVFKMGLYLFIFYHISKSTSGFKGKARIKLT